MLNQPTPTSELVSAADALEKVRHLNRLFMQASTQSDAVPDERDRMAFLYLSYAISDAINETADHLGQDG